MSNDISSFRKDESDVVENFFSRYKECLMEFAVKHNLKIDKYWHDFPSWRFSFKHPKGGVASIEIMKEGEKGLRAYGYWWVDDYDEGTRSWRRYESEIFQVDEIIMSELLDNMLKLIISWPLNSWSEVATGFKPHWSKAFSREKFMSLSEKYPTLNY